MNYGAATFLKERRIARIIKAGGKPQPIAALFTAPTLIITPSTFKKIWPKEES